VLLSLHWKITDASGLARSSDDVLCYTNRRGLVNLFPILYYNDVFTVVVCDEENQTIVIRIRIKYYIGLAPSDYSGSREYFGD